jgi:hypothetical protein
VLDCVIQFFQPEQPRTNRLVRSGPERLPEAQSILYNQGRRVLGVAATDGVAGHERGIQNMRYHEGNKHHWVS